MQIPFSGLDKQHTALLPELMPSIEQVLKSGNFILGEPVEEFEQRFADYHHRRHAVGVASGTDALILALKALDIGKGDEVITTSNTFITTVSSITLVGATPILVDIGADDNIDVNKIEGAITERTKAILPVHWTGRPCNMERVCAIAKANKLKIIEDCAQAVSARFKNKLVGTFGDVGCYSLHPFKTLNACGDAGIVITDDERLASRLKAFRQNGISAQGRCEYWSSNSRLDSLQAAILNVKLNYFEDWTKRRIEIADFYTNHLSEVAQLCLPKMSDDDYSPVFHTYILKANDRDALRAYLQEKGIETRVHYETSVHKQPAAIKAFGFTKRLSITEDISKKVLSLPIYPELEQAQLEYIVQEIKSFYDVTKEGV